MHSSKECKNVQEIDEQIAAFEYLILRVITKYRLYQDRDYYLQIGRMAIWQALKDFDDTRGNSEMYVYMRIKFMIVQEFNRQLKVNQYELVTEDEQLHYLGDKLTKPIQQDSERPSWYANLLENEKRLIELLYYQGYSMKDAALVEGVSYEAMKKRRKKLLTKIREIIEKNTDQKACTFWSE